MNFAISVPEDVLAPQQMQCWLKIKTCFLANFAGFLEILSYQYRMVSWLSCVYNENLYTWKDSLCIETWPRLLLFWPWPPTHAVQYMITTIRDPIFSAPLSIGPASVRDDHITLPISIWTCSMPVDVEIQILLNISCLFYIWSPQYTNAQLGLINSEQGPVSILDSSSPRQNGHHLGRWPFQLHFPEWKL